MTDHLDIVPDEFLDAYDTNDVSEALRKAEKAPSSTPHENMRRCPYCNSVKVRQKTESFAARPSRKPEDHKCVECGEHFDNPIRPDAADRGTP